MNGKGRSKRDERQRQALALSKSGHEVQKIAQLMGMSERTITRYLDLEDRRKSNLGRPKKHTEKCMVCGNLSKTRLPVVSHLPSEAVSKSKLSDICTVCPRHRSRDSELWVCGGISEQAGSIPCA